MTLYEITGLLQELQERAFEEAEKNEGVISDYLADFIEQLEGDRTQKAENIACVIKDNNAFIDACKKEKQAIDRKIKTAQNEVEWLKNYLKEWLDGEKIKTPRASISYRNNEAVKVEIDPEELPVQYQNVKITANKTELKKALKNGAVIEGIEIEKKQSVIIK